MGKQLIEADPLAWLHFVGLPGETAMLFDPELSSFVADADKMLRVTNPNYLAHLELQSTYKAFLGDRTLFHNVVAHHKHGLPVISVVILLRKEADGPAMTGRVAYGDLNFGYTIVRLWELSAAEMLAAPLALLPLVPLTDLSETELPTVVQQMAARYELEASEADSDAFWAATMLLMGLKYPPEFTIELLKGVMKMTESSTYQYILREGMKGGIAKGLAEGKAVGLEEGKAEGKAEGIAKGKAEEARAILMRIGTKRFGDADAYTQIALDAFTSHEQFELLVDRALEVESWRELLLG